MSQKDSKHSVISFPAIDHQNDRSKNNQNSSASFINHPSSEPKQETHLIDTTELEQVVERLHNTLPLRTQNLLQRYIYELKTLGQ